jgi:hypothetical protein
MTQDWHYSINQFLVRTVGNFVKTMEITRYHHAMLKSMAQDYPLDTDYAVMLARYTPAHENFENLYSKLRIADGQMQGSTLGMKQHLVKLRAKAQLWSSMVKVAGFDRDSEVYESLFPRGLRPFSLGAIDERVANVATLAQGMQPHAALDGVRLQVEAFSTQISAVRSEQLANKANKKNMSKHTEQARKTVLKEQYRNVGRLMEKFADTPKMILPFFNVQRLRQR